MLGPEGMAVMAVSERDDKLEYAIETTATAGWCPVSGVRSAGQAASSPPDLGSGTARGGPASDPNVGQAHLAVCASAV